MSIISWVIYGLRENVEGSKYRYVGLSTVGTAKALKRHLFEARHGDPGLKCNWIRSVDCNITIEVIEECPIGNAKFLSEREIYWIAYHREHQGNHINRLTEYYMTNMTDGGMGGGLGTKRPKTSEQVEKVAAQLRGRPRTDGAGHASHVLPREHCKLCPPGWTEEGFLALVKEACIRELQVTQMSATDLGRKFKIYSSRYHHFTVKALEELASEGLVYRIKHMNQRKWAMCDSSSS